MVARSGRTIAVIGHGSAGSRHAALLREAGVRVQVFDLNPEKSECDSYEAALKNAEAVVVATPPMHRRDLLTDLVTRELPMLVEKPLALESTGLRTLFDGGPPILIGYVWRYAPSVQAFIADVEGDLFIRYGESPACRPWPMWLNEVSCIWEYSHAVDLALWAKPKAKPFRVEGRSGGQTSLVVEAIEGADRIRIRTDYLAKPAAVWMGSGQRMWEPDAAELEQAYRAQMTHFLEVIEGRPPLVSWKDGLAVIRFIEQCLSLL